MELDKNIKNDSRIYKLNFSPTGAVSATLISLPNFPHKILSDLTFIGNNEMVIVGDFLSFNGHPAKTLLN